MLILKLLQHPIAREIALVFSTTLCGSLALFKSYKPFLAAFGLYSLLPLTCTLLPRVQLRMMGSYRKEAQRLIANQPQEKPWAELTSQCTATQERYVVVGGSGFVGQRLVHALWLRGERNVLVVDLDLQAIQDMRKRYAEGVEFCQANVMNREEISLALRGADCVFAPFAVIRFWESLPKHWSRSFGVNVDGMRNVCDACVEHGVKRLITTGSSAIVETFPSMHPDGFDECTQPVNTNNYLSNYSLSKAHAEAIALSYNSPSLQVASIRPCSSVFGYGDKLALAFIQRGFYPVIYPANKIDYVHVDSVALAQLLCEYELRKPGNLAAGEAFCVSGEAMEDGTFASLVLELAPTKVSIQLLPGRLVLMLSGLLSLVQWVYPWDLVQLVGKDLGQLTLPTILTACKHLLVKDAENSKARRILGYQPHKSLVGCVKQTMQEISENRVIME